jgi:hypothetical protein
MSSGDEKIQQVWEKGKIVPNYDKDKYRKDQCSAWVARDKYDDRKSRLGWEIDHTDQKGDDNLSNLHPLQWKNNVARGEGRLERPATADGDKNMEKEE